MEFVIVFIIGAILGGLIGHTVTKPHPVGTLRIDASDPDDGPYMFLELESDTRHIASQKQVCLNVSTESYLSQK